MLEVNICGAPTGWESTLPLITGVGRHARNNSGSKRELDYPVGMGARREWEWFSPGWDRIVVQAWDGNFLMRIHSCVTL